VAHWISCVWRYGQVTGKPDSLVAELDFAMFAEHTNDYLTRSGDAAGDP